MSIEGGRVSLGLDEAAPAVPMAVNRTSLENRRIKKINVCFLKKKSELVQLGRSST
jgi:hypothetical protein